MLEVLQKPQEVRALRVAAAHAYVRTLMESEWWSRMRLCRSARNRWRWIQAPSPPMDAVLVSVDPSRYRYVAVPGSPARPAPHASHALCYVHRLGQATQHSIRGHAQREVKKQPTEIARQQRPSTVSLQPQHGQGTETKCKTRLVMMFSAGMRGQQPVN